VKRRICLVGAALSVCPLVFGAGPALAAGKTKSKTKAAKPTMHQVACTTATGIMIASGESTVSPPASQGVEYGTASCGVLLGGGVQKDSFTVPTSGDTLASFGMYFRTGTLHGTYDLTPEQGQLNFLETDWTGTMKVLSGTGTLKGITGTGTMTCKTLDGIHTTCTDRLKLKVPPATS